MVNVKPITDKSWLLYASPSNEKLGLLSQNPKGFTLFSTDTKTQFSDKSEIIDFFNEDIFKNIIETRTASEFFIQGYPVSFENPFAVDTDNKITKLPLYAKTKDSNVHHCAGYYCIKFPKGYVFSFCPKYSTMSTYEHHGPYKTEERAKEELSILRKKARQNAST